MTILDSNTIPSGGASIATTLVVNAFSTAGVAPAAMTSAANRGGKITLSGALTSGVLKSMISVAGKAGRMSLCAVHTNDATAQTLRLQVIVDGVTGSPTFDTTSSSVSASNLGILAAGTTDSSAGNILFDGQEITWKTSLDVSIASSASATDKITFVSKYVTEA